MLCHLEPAGEASRLRCEYKASLLQSMLTVMSLTILSVVFFWCLEEEGQKELFLIKSQEK